MGHESGLVNGYANLASALARAGRLDEALAWSERTIEAARRIGDELAVADACVTQATAFLARGDALAAGRRAEDAAERFEMLRAGPPAREALGLAAQAWEAAGDADRADAVRKRAAAVV
jgi:tetratricopeptide (TPR) repeat protein